MADILHRVKMPKKEINIIQVKDLVKKFNGLTAVDRVSFAVKKGEIFAFLGPNGAGKSTTIKMLTLVKKFSGGMKRRLEIARGLLHHPKVLFLDEPTLGLDPQTREHVWTYIKKVNREEGMTVFFTTHYMEEAELAAPKDSNY